MCSVKALVETAVSNRIEALKYEFLFPVLQNAKRRNFYNPMAFLAFVSHFLLLCIKWKKRLFLKILSHFAIRSFQCEKGIKMYFIIA